MLWYIIIIVSIRREGYFFCSCFYKIRQNTLPNYQNFYRTTQNQLNSENNLSQSKCLSGKPKFKPFLRSLFSQSDSSYFEKLKITLLGSCTEMSDLTHVLNFFCCVALLDVKILLLLFRNNELT